MNAPALNAAYTPSETCTVCREPLEQSDAVTCETCFQRPDGRILSVHTRCAAVDAGAAICNKCERMNI